MQNLFKYIAIAEGYSFLIILFVTMPLKYIGKLGWPNQFIGMGHGVLFIAYIALALLVAIQLKWSIKRSIVVMLMSFVPFGTFWVDEKYLS